MTNILADLKMYGRYALGLRGFFRSRITLAYAEAIIQQRLADREANFLRLMERGVFGYSQSPYLPLLKMIGCELGDIHNMVQARGLESTLHHLRQAGVYVTFEEYKGRKHIVRNGNVIEIRPGQFDNPYLTRHYHATTGGTTGPGTRVAIDLEHLAANAPISTTTPTLMY